MLPQTPQSNRSHRRPPAPLAYQRVAGPVSASQRPHTPTQPAQRDAAAKIIHQQIDRIYDQNSPHQATEEAIRAQQTTQGGAQSSKPEESKTQESAYDHTHQNNDTYTNSENGSVKQYHAAWQNYYQKYYERYYMQQLHASRQQLHQRAQAAAQPQQTQALPTVSSHTPQSITKDQAVQELRGKLLGTIKERAGKARKSRHFIPITSAVVVALIFVFLQYNRQLVAQVQAYVSPGSIDPQNIVLDPTASTEVSDEPRLVIPKINVDAPVVYDLDSIAEDKVQAALNNGVVHYPIPGANSMPGQAGNSVILGHSSNDVFNTGAYKFIFVQLDKLEKGDTFYAHYKGTRYTYSVTGKEIIEPNQINKLVMDSKKPIMTLVTCTPPGTALKRLVVYADQISPNPSSASAAPEKTQEKDPKEIPDYYSPTIFERLFGGFN